MSLRSLDERAVPEAARWLRRQVERAHRLAARVAERAEVLQPRRLDDRLLDRGPLALAARRPSAALVVVGAVLVAGVGSAVDLERRAADGPRAQLGELTGQSDVPRGALLGPSVGDSTTSYEEASRRGLVDAVQAAPNRPRVALVSLIDYRTPAQANALLAGYTVQRVYLRAKAAGKQATPLPVEVKGDLLASLKAAYEETARTRKAAQRSYQSYVDALRPESSQDKVYRDLYRSFARSTGIEAEEYARGCACVYAVLVTASPAQLLSLQARPGVRTVQVAAAELTVLQVQVQPLLPEVRGRVPRPSVAGAS